MLAILLSPPPVWLALTAGLTLGVGLVDRRLALLAGLAVLALLLGAGRGAVATLVQLPPGLSGRVVTISGLFSSLVPVLLPIDQVRGNLQLFAIDL